MKTKKTLFIAIAIACFVIAITLVSREPQQVNAQDQIPPPVNDRISFGTVGITSGQTIRVSVANTIMPNDVNLPPGPSRVLINFRLPNGNLARDGRSGDVIRKVVDLARGDSTFLDLDYSDLPPGPTRIQLRPVVVVQPPPIGEFTGVPPDGTVPTVEIINNANGRTQFAVSANPGVIRGFNPQPDPPVE